MAEVYQQQRSNSSLRSSNPHATHELVVEASTEITPSHDTSLMLPAEMIPVTGCCCSKKGSISLQTKFVKTTIPVVSTTPPHHNNNNNNINNPESNNTCSVEFRCHNQSSVGVDRIRLQLIETIEWTSNGYQEELKSVLTKVDLNASEFPELNKLRKGDRRRLEGREYFGLGSCRDDVLQQQPWHTIGPVQVPKHAKDTYHGRAIQIRHVLSVELITTGCCKSNPDASIMVQLYRRLAQSQEEEVGGGDDPLMSLPSAPVEDGLSLTPSAPSELYDDQSPTSTSCHCSSSEVITTTTATLVASSSSTRNAFSHVLPVVEAQALPSDWNAQTAEVVTIPMAEAIVLGPF
jgi:hypothetical protein